MIILIFLLASSIRGEEVLVTKSEVESIVASMIKPLTHRIKCLVDSVAFTVGVTSTTSAPINVKIPYDRVINNIGNGYTVITHEFIAPVAGNYMFYINIVTAGGNCYIALYKDETMLDTQVAWSSGSNQAQGTSAAVLMLGEGEKVSVRAKTPSSGCSLQTAYSTFSGFKI